LSIKTNWLLNNVRLSGVKTIVAQTNKYPAVSRESRLFRELRNLL